MDIDTTPETEEEILASESLRFANVESALPFDSTQVPKDQSFKYSEKEEEFRQYFKRADQFHTFVSLPLTEAQRNAYMSKLQGDYAKEQMKKKVF